LNAWAVYNWENNMQMSQKNFIIEAVRGILAEIKHPARALYSRGDDSDMEEFIMSPAAAATPAAERFVCRLI